jgi:5-methylcytosine-specific restriction endonuclease McrA
MWSSSNRSNELPDNWSELRSLVLRRDGWTCRIQSVGCLTNATDVDHVRRGSDHSIENLRAACERCHNRKSSAEGHARKRELRSLRKRPLERHPGSR